MAMISMTKSSFTVCPEGVHVFRIYNVDYKEEFGKLSIFLVNAQGATHIERYSLMKNDGSLNEGACASFSYFAKTALNNSNLEEIDHTELINHYIKAEVKHTIVPSNKDENKTVTFVNLGNKWVADGFDTEPCKKALKLGNVVETPKNTPTTSENNAVDLNSLLD